MVNRELGVVVNRNSNYTNYSFDPFTFTVVLTLFPFIYIIPTFVIIVRIVGIFIRNVLRKKDATVNRSVFTVLVLSLFSLLEFVDNTFLRIDSDQFTFISLIHGKAFVSFGIELF
uniref:Serpentine receptor class gamma n=1 Tax=Caenorhabditis tropicalis TaxID=1561998 RepID=A0A1I7TX40_9PELO